MKHTSLRFTGLAGLLLILTFSLQAQVGINTITPVQMLDVNGNVKIDGALMPGNLAGTANEILLSGGPGTPAIWGPELLNTSQTLSIGKFFVNGISIPTGSLILTVTDTNVVISSTCSITWFQITPGLPITDFSGLHIISKAEAGQWVFYIENHTGSPLTAGFSYVAYY